MPRQARLDDPGTLHHVMIRGIEGKSIFRDNRNRKEFVTRLGNLTRETGTRVLAWSLLRNHVHRGVYFRYRQGYSENGGQILKVQIFPYVPGPFHPLKARSNWVTRRG
jgi:REP element-mobilizing transposase RayT